ncbi:hypothetical protein COO60DRAFT_269195 [Scenedesmus sp. NREL 46B-D3]|nr:hypothetical protein COO60DRAFT_269195 [Scenedesmus sp. NREL 46B-D3]
MHQRLPLPNRIPAGPHHPPPPTTASNGLIENTDCCQDQPLHCRIIRWPLRWRGTGTAVHASFCRDSQLIPSLLASSLPTSSSLLDQATHTGSLQHTNLNNHSVCHAPFVLQQATPCKALPFARAAQTASMHAPLCDLCSPMLHWTHVDYTQPHRTLIRSTNRISPPGDTAAPSRSSRFPLEVGCGTASLAAKDAAGLAADPSLLAVSVCTC